MFTVILPMLYTASVMPVQVFYIDGSQDDIGWLAMEITVSACFFLDVLLTFNLAVYDSGGMLVTSR